MPHAFQMPRLTLFWFLNSSVFVPQAKRVLVILRFVQSRPLSGLTFHKPFSRRFCSYTLPTGTHMHVCPGVHVHPDQMCKVLKKCLSAFVLAQVTGLLWKSLCYFLTVSAQHSV